MPSYKLSSKAGVVTVTGTLAVAKRVASALASATGSEVHGAIVGTPKRRKKAAPKRRRAKAAVKPVRRKKRRAKSAPARRSKSRVRKSSKRRKSGARRGLRRS